MNLSQQSILVTGASGAVGPPLVEALLRTGAQVRTMSRTQPTSSIPNVEHIKGDVAYAQDVHRAARGCQIVFHLASKLHINKPSPSLVKEYRDVNVLGTKHVVQAAADNAARLILFSTIAVYGTSNMNMVLTESSVLQPRSLYGLTKKEAEIIAGIYPLTTILRLSAVYGPNMKGNYVHLFKALESGLFIPVGNGINRRTLVHVEDVAQAAVLVASQPQAIGETFNVTDGNIHTLKEIIETLAKLQGVRAPKYWFPLKPANLLCKLADIPIKKTGRSGIFSHMLDKFTEDMAVSGDKIQNLLGFSPTFNNLETGWAHALSSILVKDMTGA